VVELHQVVGPGQAPGMAGQDPACGHLSLHLNVK
jgi:hypothetical protein